MLADYSWFCLPITLRLYLSSTFRVPIPPLPLCSFAFFLSCHALQPLSSPSLSPQPSALLFILSASLITSSAFSSSPQTTHSFPSDLSTVAPSHLPTHFFPSVHLILLCVTSISLFFFLPPSHSHSLVLSPPPISLSLSEYFMIWWHSAEVRSLPLSRACAAQIFTPRAELSWVLGQTNGVCVFVCVSYK